MKKLFLVGVVVFLLSLCFSTSSFALTDGDWEYTLLDGEAVITAYLGDGGDVVIPEKIYGATVTSIRTNSIYNGDLFRLNDKITSVSFPSTIKEIPSLICDECENLESVIIPEGIETIGDGAFSHCKKLTSVKVPSTVKKIDGGAFSECSSLKDFNFNENIDFIGEGAFGLTAFEELDLQKLSPNVVIEKRAFQGCENLKSVKLHNNVKEISRWCFTGCTSLTNVEIPNTVTRIGGNAFEGCTALENIILPSSLLYIDESAFNNTNLKYAVIPYGTKEVGWCTFGDNSNLEALFIPDTVEEINVMVTYESPNVIMYCTENSATQKMCKERQLSYLTDKSVNSGITVLYNGSRVSFHLYDQNPELIEGRTLVPLRAIFEAMKAEVDWDGNTSTVTAKRGSITISIQIGANVMYKNGVALPVDVPAQLINGRTMVPVRVIAESFGADVQWNGNGNVVLITE